MKIRSVALEVLRHGPAHNQLISPLVPYLALCGEAEAETLRLPLEHRQLLDHLAALRYDAKADGERTHHLRVMQGHVTEILSSIRGLASEAQRAQAPVLHLRLVATPLELAMLPFELALMPAGLPGAGSPMLINPARKITFTREVRSATRARFVWPTEMRVLFVSSRAGGAVPTRAHALALMRALRPWSGVNSRTGELSYDGLLTTLLDPTPQELRKAIAEGSFTHIHILAHGRAESSVHGDEYGLMLHGDDGQPKLLGGERLAKILRAGEERPPTVVTLAACDSGNAGTVLVPGASLAQRLHQSAEIPLVVGSQYPLSFRGSVMLTETLYEQLAAGRDPRLAVMDVRERLYIAAPENHDWASLVVYARMPEDFDEQMANLELGRIDLRGRAANAWAWHADWEGDSPLGADLAAERRAWVHQEAKARLAAAIAHQHQRAEADEEAALAATDPRVKQRYRDRRCTLGGLHKRDAVRQWAGRDPARPEPARRAALAALRRALQAYEQANDIDRAHHWPATQVLGIHAILEGKISGDRADLWRATWWNTTRDMQTDRDERWAATDLVELLLLAPLVERCPLPDREARAEAKRLLLELVRSCGQDSIEVRLTALQLRRYTGWFADLGGEPIFGLRPRVEELLAVLGG